MRLIDIPGGATESVDNNWIGIIVKVESLKVPYSDVLYIEQIGAILHIIRDEDILKIPGRMSDLSKILRAPFSQSHSYLMVNFDRVYSMTKGQIVFDNKKEKYIGKDSFTKTRKRFNQYLLGE